MSAPTSRRCDSLLTMLRRLDARGDARDDAVAAAAAALRAGQLVAFPTETVYGLGAVARDSSAVARLYAAKRRPRAHPLIVHLADAGEAAAWGHLGASAKRVAEALWPGPLTLVLRARDDVPRDVTGGQESVALRVPGHPVAQALLHAVGEGVVAPSANRFGRVSPTTAEHVLAEFGDDEAVALVLDGGPCRVGLESTILDLSGPTPQLLRPGGIARETLEAALGEVVGDPDGTAPRVPGSLRRHYAPRLPTRLVSAEAAQAAGPEVAVVLRDGEASRAPRLWRLPDDPAGYGRRLYATLRDVEQSGARELWIVRLPGDRTWEAIRDRVGRAASDDDEEGTT
jgi:L-threonylcarbamoyladenylate synthase